MRTFIWWCLGLQPMQKSICDRQTQYPPPRLRLPQQPQNEAGKSVTFPVSGFCFRWGSLLFFLARGPEHHFWFNFLYGGSLASPTPHIPGNLPQWKKLEIVENVMVGFLIKPRRFESQYTKIVLILTPTTHPQRTLNNSVVWGWASVQGASTIWFCWSLILLITFFQVPLLSVWCRFFRPPRDFVCCCRFTLGFLGSGPRTRWHVLKTNSMFERTNRVIK